VKDQLAATRCGVDLLLKRAEADVAVLQGIYRLDEMTQGAAKTVKTPDNEGVTRTKMRDCLFESWPILLRARGSVSKDVVTSSCFESILLQVEGLFKR
jgi:hypothetical protein